MCPEQVGIKQIMRTLEPLGKMHTQMSTTTSFEACQQRIFRLFLGFGMRSTCVTWAYSFFMSSPLTGFARDIFKQFGGGTHTQFQTIFDFPYDRSFWQTHNNFETKKSENWRVSKINIKNAFSIKEVGESRQRQTLGSRNSIYRNLSRIIPRKVRRDLFAMLIKS